MANEELKKIIYDWLPLIDEILDNQNIPIFQRHLNAAVIFTENAIKESSFESNEKLLKSDTFSDVILPIFNDWYWETYGELARRPKSELLSGIASSYAQPILLKIPVIISKVEKINETAWLTFPDHFMETEDLQSIIDHRVKVNKLQNNQLESLRNEIIEVVSLSRSIRLNLTSATLNNESFNMASGIWNHFEKAILDILSLKSELATIGCWELHFAIEKTFKVFIMQKGNKKFGHSLKELNKEARKLGLNLSDESLNALPSHQDANHFRYVEKIMEPHQAVDYYKKSLRIVALISSQLNRKFKINNASFLVKISSCAK